MRISAWSSVVCSSDLENLGRRGFGVVAVEPQLPIVDVRHPVVADFVIVEARQEGVDRARRLQVDVAKLLCIGLQDVIDVEQIAEGVFGHRARRQSRVTQIILALFLDDNSIKYKESEVCAREAAVDDGKAHT